MLEQRWQDRVETIRDYREWSATGRVAVLMGDEGGQASLRWRQRGERFDIQLFDPLGRRMAELEGSDESVSLRRASGDVTRARDAEALLHQEMGWRLPVAGLRHWALGLPEPDRPVEGRSLDRHGRLERLQQAGWTIRYQAYADGTPRALPRRIRLARGDALEVKLVVDQWQVTSP